MFRILARAFVFEVPGYRAQVAEVVREAIGTMTITRPRLREPEGYAAAPGRVTIEVMCPVVSFSTFVGAFLPLVFGPEPGRVRLWSSSADSWQWLPGREPWREKGGVWPGGK